MGSDEFQVIERWFKTLTTATGGVSLGPGDDCALVEPPPGELIAVTTDTLIEGVHFPADTPAHDVGHKALAVNLSDIAAMGARPKWVTLALTLPAADESWLADFTRGFATLADRYGVALVGGDLTRGPLTVTVQALGGVARENALSRSGALAGERICVTGTLGDAAAGLAIAKDLSEPYPDDVLWLRRRLSCPEPRVEAGLLLGGEASAAIDVSDGLAQDLGHILGSSNVGATLDVAHLPLSSALRSVAGDLAREYALSGGDDYELCFTVGQRRLSAILEKLSAAGTGATVIGLVESSPGLRARYLDGTVQTLPEQGFRHF